VIEYADGKVDRFEYDALGRLTAAINADCELTYEYDKAGRQIKRQQGEYAFESKVDSKSGKVVWNWPEGIGLAYEVGELDLTTVWTLRVVK